MEMQKIIQKAKDHCKFGVRVKFFAPYEANVQNRMPVTALNPGDTSHLSSKDYIYLSTQEHEVGETVIVLVKPTSSTGCVTFAKVVELMNYVDAVKDPRVLSTNTGLVVCGIKDNWFINLMNGEQQQEKNRTKLVADIVAAQKRISLAQLTKRDKKLKAAIDAFAENGGDVDELLAACEEEL